MVARLADLGDVLARAELAVQLEELAVVRLEEPQLRARLRLGGGVAVPGGADLLLVAREDLRARGTRVGRDRHCRDAQVA